MVDSLTSIKQFIIRILDSFSYTALIIIAVALGLAPFTPEPHLVEKLRMLSNAQLTRPIDIFDLFLHASPVILIFLKLTLRKKTGATTTDNEPGK